MALTLFSLNFLGDGLARRPRPTDEDDVKKELIDHLSFDISHLSFGYEFEREYEKRDV